MATSGSSAARKQRSILKFLTAASIAIGITVAVPAPSFGDIYFVAAFRTLVACMFAFGLSCFLGFIEAQFDRLAKD